MMRQIKVVDLCSELERMLVGLHYSDDSMRRYRKVFREFTVYANDCYYSQSKCIKYKLVIIEMTENVGDNAFVA